MNSTTTFYYSISRFVHKLFIYLSYGGSKATDAQFG